MGCSIPLDNAAVFSLPSTLVIALKKKISNAASIDPQDRYFVGVVRMLSFQLILLLVSLALAYTAYKNI